MSELTGLGAVQAAERLAGGEATSEDLVRACLARIEELEPEVQAWAYLDEDKALQQARRADRQLRTGDPLSLLHGIPVGIKDIFDTADMPTEYGTELHAGRHTRHDATVVARLRAAGAVILGKTVTTELAVYSPGATRNPLDTGRTPGGSSSGSAAAVAAGMVPLAVGTQTNGSIVRPASFCGVCGYKPSYGLISRCRVLAQSRLLDHVGVFARTVDDAALLAEQLVGFDENDPDTRPRARFRLLDAARGAPAAVRLAFVRSPVWDQADADTRAAFEELAASLGIEALDLPGAFEEGVGWHRTIFEADLARSYRHEYETGRDKLSAVLREIIERGLAVRAVDYKEAQRGREALQVALSQVFDHCDAFITPAAPGQAPAGLASTGSPVFGTLWTLCGSPAISLPLLRGGDGLPIGVQLVGSRDQDERLMQTAAWLMRQAAAAAVA